MHNIEYKAQNLEAQKLQMANESTQVYQEYEDALNKQKVQFKQIGTDGAATYVDVDIQTLINAGYKIMINAGNKWFSYLPSNTTNNYTQWREYSTTPIELSLASGYNGSVSAGNVASTITVGGKQYVYPITAEDIKNGDTTVKIYPCLTVGSTANEAKALNELDFNNIEVLRNLFEAGMIVLKKPMSDGTYEEVNIATDTSLQEVSDETLLKKAEAKYEADMRKINQKDKKFDTDLAAMDAERNAIKTEMDTLKSVAKENVDRTFKLFG